MAKRKTKTVGFVIWNLRLGWIEGGKNTTEGELFSKRSEATKVLKTLNEHPRDVTIIRLIIPNPLGGNND